MENSNARVMQLEAALASAVAYLRRLPRVPTTTAEIRSAEQVLHSATEFTPMVGEHFSPAGVPMIRAALTGNILTLTTTELCSLPEMIEAHQKWLYDGLKAGYKLELSAAPQTARSPRLST